MFKRFAIRNFRCFASLCLEQLDRVNLIAGKNNTGKTALLEALFLHIGPNSPHIPINLNAFRGLEQVDVNAEEMWGWMFFNKESKETIELTSRTANDQERKLKILLAEPVGETVVASGNGSSKPLPSRGSLTTEGTQRELVLDYEDSTGQKGISRVELTGLGLKIQQARFKPFPVGVILTTRFWFPREDAERFSKLEQVGRQEEVVQILKLLEPRLKRLAVLVSGGVPGIHGDIGIGKLVPLQLMGEGLVRLLSIVLVIVNAPGGTLLVDEVENGLHYSVMKDVWKAIAVAARQMDVQIFATTHSWECIQAAHRAFKESGPYEFRYHRLDRHEESISVKSFDERMLDAVENSDLEPR